MKQTYVRAHACMNLRVLARGTFEGIQAFKPHLRVELSDELLGLDVDHFVSTVTPDIVVVGAAEFLEVLSGGVAAHAVDGTAGGRGGAGGDGRRVDVLEVVHGDGDMDAGLRRGVALLEVERAHGADELHGVGGDVDSHRSFLFAVITSYHEQGCLENRHWPTLLCGFLSGLGHNGLHGSLIFHFKSKLNSIVFCCFEIGPSRLSLQKAGRDTERSSWHRIPFTFCLL